MRVRLIIAALLGAIEALLLVRLLLRLLAARPDNPFVAAFLWSTAPLSMPFAALDANQPRYGATLELASLALFLLLAVGAGILAIVWRRGAIYKGALHE
ncbi:MAG TPA: YggT family protein [Roseiflexaceae bacterium]|nr:YggT family protein [Roseiflexaceae bacterium]